MHIVVRDFSNRTLETVRASLKKLAPEAPCFDRKRPAVPLEKPLNRAGLVSFDPGVPEEENDEEDDIQFS